MRTMSTMIDMPDKALHEKCGVFGALAPVASQGAASTVATAQSLGELLYYGLYALQHRGQETCGMAVFEHDHLRLHKDLGLVSQVFQDHQVKRLKGQVGVGHTRYSTAGDGQLANAQPVIARTPLGALALAHNGNLINPERLLSQFGPFEAEPFGHESDSWILAQALGAAIERALSSSDHTGSFEQRRIDAVKGVLDACQGAFSIVVAMGDCLIAARDCNGIRPLSLGQITEGPSAGTWVVASETCAMDIVGATNVRDIAPGEIWIGTRGGKTHSIRLSGPAQERFCVFEMVYFARTDSRLCEQSVYIYRLALGKLLAERDKTLLPPNAVDMVIAVPDSGTTAAIGYSQASGVPFVEGLIKNRYVGRTFINPSEGIRQQGLRLKLNPLTDVLSGKRVVVIDDSIVRGNTSRRLVALLKEAGVAEIHLRVSSPPVKHPCFYGIDMSDPEELIANHQNESQLKDWLGVDSLAYLPLEGLEQAFLATRAPGQSCKACFDNDYPAGVPSGAKTTLEPRDTIMLA